MADQSSTNEADQSAAHLTVDDNAIVPRIRLSEQGYVGLKVSSGQIIEEANTLFRTPYFFKVRDEMMNDPTIAAGFNVYRMLISRVQWTVEPPIGATEQQKARAKFVQQCMTDMETSWGSFISEVLTYLEYGHSIQEKVFRRRLKKNGSRYNDGLVGLRKLSPRAQETIAKWYFSEDGRDLVAIGQSVKNLQDSGRVVPTANTNKDGLIEIPREKFLLFAADSTKGNPQGRSLLKSIYLAYRRMQMLQEQELTGVAKDSAGLPVIQIPPQYMAEDASEQEQLVYTMCKNIVDNLANGTQRGIVFPKLVDVESKQEMFTIDLLDRKGNPQYDINEIIRRYQHDILVALSVDVISMGQDKGGSFSLADAKTSLLSMALDHRLKEIADVLNNDLVKALYDLNGWADSELPKFVPGDVEKVSMDEMGKYLQRVASVGLVEKSRGVLNRIYEVGGLPVRPEDEEIDEDNLTGADSRSGDGLEVGRSGNGTSKIGGKGSNKDSSVSNSENKE